MRIDGSRIASGLNTASEKIGKKLANIKTPEIKAGVDKFIKMYDPIGSNNSFFGMATLMVFTVIAPRIVTAMKRNPDDKEATIDEIKEILFRDIQTVLIMLFALKTANSIVGHFGTKFSGLPMVNKTYDKLCPGVETTGLKGFKDKLIDITHHPNDKIKIIFGNIKKALNPLGGVYSLTNDEFVQKYSGYNSMPEIKKLLDDIYECGGDDEKVYNNIINSLIKNQEKNIKIANDLKVGGAAIDGLDKMNEVLAILKKAQRHGIKALDEPTLSQKIEGQFVNFFQDKNNKLVKKSKIMNAGLRTGALTFESLYLGFGLPALNQKRLEKKYLQNQSQKEQLQPQQQIQTSQDNFTKTIKNEIRPEELNLYSKFIKY